MIDASTFSMKHSSFWTDSTPTCEYFVRRLNLEYVERWNNPVQKPSRKIRAALVAEVAFVSFCNAKDQIPSDTISVNDLQEAIARIKVFTSSMTDLSHELSADENGQALSLRKNLYDFFINKRQKINIRPLFHGCGYIDTSEADIICGKSLFEIKTVDRPFRSSDIRQIVTYCALNHVSKQYELTNIGLFNPRSGLYFLMELDKVIY